MAGHIRSAADRHVERRSRSACDGQVLREVRPAVPPTRRRPRAPRMSGSALRTWWITLGSWGSVRNLDAFASHLAWTVLEIVPFALSGVKDAAVALRPDNREIRASGSSQRRGDTRCQRSRL